MSKKYDDDRGNSRITQDYPFSNLEKSLVVQETRVFNEYPVNPRKCRQVVTKLVLLLQKESFSRTEATDLFFSITKLFQNQDVFLFITT